MVPRLARSVFFELVLNPKRDAILTTVSNVFVTSLEQQIPPSPSLTYYSMIHDLDPDDAKGICSTFLCSPLHDFFLRQLGDMAILPTLLMQIDSWKERIPCFEEWKGNLLSQLSSDDIRYGVQLMEPFPFSLCSSLFPYVTHQCQWVLLEMCEAAAEKECQTPTNGEHLISILTDCSLILGPKLHRLLRLSLVLETVELFIHEELSAGRLTEEMMNGLLLFKEERQKDAETLYYSLFLFRWCQGTFNREVEKQASIVLQPLLSPSIIASMTQIRELRGQMINTALLSPFLGNPAYRYEVGSTEDRSYEIQGEYVGANVDSDM